MDHGEGARRALGLEALDVVVSRAEAGVALPLVRHDLTLAERAAALRHARPHARTGDEWIADIAGDPENVWRSAWLAACALHSAPGTG